MIDFDTWYQRIELKLDKADFVFEDDLRMREVILDYYGIISQMDDDDCDYWHLQTALDMDACHHELSTMTI